MLSNISCHDSAIGTQPGVYMVALVVLTRGLALNILNERYEIIKVSHREHSRAKNFTLIREKTRIIIKISNSRAIHVTVAHYSNFSRWQFLLRASYELKLMNNYLAEAESVSLLSGNSNIRNRN